MLFYVFLDISYIKNAVLRLPTTPFQFWYFSFWDKIEKTWTFVHGRPDNLSVSQADDGTCQLYAIDGYAFGQFIPLAKWFRKDQKRLLRKRKRNQAAAIQKIIDAKHHGGEITNNGFLNPPNPQKEE